jgi:hypothetical protein
MDLTKQLHFAVADTRELANGFEFRMSGGLPPPSGIVGSCSNRNAVRYSYLICSYEADQGRPGWLSRRTGVKESARRSMPNRRVVALSSEVDVSPLTIAARLERTASLPVNATTIWSDPAYEC